MKRPDGLPHFLTPEEAAELLRMTRKALYVLIERGQLPGVWRRSRRRILIRTDALLKSLDDQQGTSSPRGVAR